MTPGGVTVPAGSMSANFPITAPQVNAQPLGADPGALWSNAGMHAAVLEIDRGHLRIPGSLTIGVEPDVGDRRAARCAAPSDWSRRHRRAARPSTCASDGSGGAGAGQREHRRRQQRDQLHDHDERRDQLTLGAASTGPPGRRDEVRLPDVSTDPNAGVVCSTPGAERRRYNRRKQHSRDALPQRNGPAWRSRGHALEQQSRRGPGAGERHRCRPARASPPSASRRRRSPRIRR